MKNALAVTVSIASICLMLGGVVTGILGGIDLVEKGTGIWLLLLGIAATAGGCILYVVGDRMCDEIDRAEGEREINERLGIADQSDQSGARGAGGKAGNRKAAAKGDR